MPRNAAVLLAAYGLAGCNRYNMFNIAGYEQETFSNKADILFVVDNSSSMADEAAALGLNFNAFIERLTSAEGGTPRTEDLSDAVDNYINYVSDRGRYIDYQLAITTTTVDYSQGDSSGVDPGEAGLLLGYPTVISRDYADVAETFRKNLLCEATCWSTADLQDVSDPDHVCGDPISDPITPEYLDCLCGADEWKDHCGSGDEEHLEAGLLALCRAAAEVPEGCYDSLSPFTEDDIGTNAGLLREDATAVVVYVTDEGDNSRRLEQGTEEPGIYLETIEEFGFHVREAAIGPDYEPGTTEITCNNGGATTWGVARLIELTEETSGFYNPITSGEEEGCEVSDFSVHLDDLGELLHALVTSFRLQSIPDEDTIRVYVEGIEVPPSDETVDQETGNITYGDGWSYEASENAVVFWGDAVPDYNEDVRIYYLPLDGKPRELPF